MCQQDDECIAECLDGDGPDSARAGSASRAIPIAHTLASSRLLEGTTDADEDDDDVALSASSLTTRSL
jgi:hypothetical protein